MIGFIGTSLQLQQLTSSNRLRLAPFLTGPRVLPSTTMNDKRRITTEAESYVTTDGSVGQSVLE
jgi:hypothetical protein